MIAKKNRRKIGAILCAIIMAGISIHALTPGQRGAIQNLTKEIKANKLSPAEAHKKALELKVPANQMHDFIVQELISVADQKGIIDIFDATLAAKTMPVAQMIALPTPQTIQRGPEPKVTPVPAENPEVQKLYNDYKIFSASIDTFKPGTSYVENKRRLILFTNEYERMVKTMVQLSTDTSAFKSRELHPKDREIIEKFSNTLLPAMFQKLHSINDAIEKQEKSVKQVPAEPETPYRISETTADLVGAYANKEYTTDQIMGLRKKNLQQEKLSNPYAGKTKEELFALLEPYSLKWIADKTWTWDIRNVIDTFYLLSLAKLRLKELDNKDFASRNKISKALIGLLTKDGNTSSLVFDFSTNNTPIKNKYFVELIDEFEKQQTAAPVISTPSPTIQDFPVQKIDKLSSDEEKDYFEDIMLGGGVRQNRFKR